MEVKRKKLKALTLIEAMIALGIITVTSLGALSYQYHGARHFRQARAEITGTQIGELLLEDWKSVGGVDTYRIGGPDNHNPASLRMGFTGQDGNYKITMNNVNYFITLEQPVQIGKDDQYAGKLWQIEVKVQWRNDFASSSPGAGDPALVFTTYGRNQD